MRHRLHLRRHFFYTFGKFSRHWHGDDALVHRVEDLVSGHAALRVLADNRRPLLLFHLIQLRQGHHFVIDDPLPHSEELSLDVSDDTPRVITPPAVCLFVHRVERAICGVGVGLYHFGGDRVWAVLGTFPRRLTFPRSSFHPNGRARQFCSASHRQIRQLRRRPPFCEFCLRRFYVSISGIDLVEGVRDRRVLQFESRLHVSLERLVLNLDGLLGENGLRQPCHHVRAIPSDDIAEYISDTPLILSGNFPVRSRQQFSPRACEPEPRGVPGDSCESCGFRG